MIPLVNAYYRDLFANLAFQNRLKYGKNGHFRAGFMASMLNNGAINHVKYLMLYVIF